MSCVRVISPGFLTTVQDLGRFGYAHLGISAAGAADVLSLRLGNLIVGNSENAPALEMTLVGAEIEFPEASIIALAGADMKPTLDEQSIPMWTSISINPGQVLKCGVATSGFRAYLCVRGGIDVPLVFGSVSTHLQSRLGGFCGRALKNGDIVPLAGTAPSGSFKPLQVDPAVLSKFEPRKILRVTSGPQAHLFTQVARQLFYSSSYEITQESDRMGLRLKGVNLARKNDDSEIVTEGVSLGAVQITHAGTPIILFVDHQTTGGYPKIANVISADMHNVGQLRPGDQITFAPVSLPDACALLNEQESLIRQHPFFPA